MYIEKNKCCISDSKSLSVSGEGERVSRVSHTESTLCEGEVLKIILPTGH